MVAVEDIVEQKRFIINRVNEINDKEMLSFLTYMFKNVELLQPTASSNVSSKNKVREGWEEDAIRGHKLGDDKLLMPDVFEDEDLSWWKW